MHIYTGNVASLLFLILPLFTAFPICCRRPHLFFNKSENLQVVSRNSKSGSSLGKFWN